MIGNDIVDLNLAKTQSNWQRKGFLEKQYTAKEQEEILSAKNPFFKVWLFWSMKEAAYKIYVQQFGIRFFNPLKLVCSLDSKSDGFVTIGNTTFFTKSVISEEYIYTIAVSKNSKNYNSECLKVENKSYLKKTQKLNQSTETFKVHIWCGVQMGWDGVGWVQDHIIERCNVSRAFPPAPHHLGKILDEETFAASKDTNCTALHCPVLHCTALTALPCTALQCTPLHSVSWGEVRSRSYYQTI